MDQSKSQDDSRRYFSSAPPPFRSRRESRKYTLYDSLPPKTTDEKGNWTNVSEDSRFLDNFVARIRGYPSQREHNVREIIELVYSMKIPPAFLRERHSLERVAGANWDSVADETSHQVPDTVSRNRPTIKRRGGRRKRGPQRPVFQKYPSIRPYSSEPRGSSDLHLAHKSSQQHQPAASSRHRDVQQLDTPLLKPESTFRDATYFSTIPVLRSPDTFYFSEKILHSINLFFLELFRSSSWYSDKFTLIPPEGTKSLEKEWKDISDKCWSLGAFFRKGAASEEGKLKLRSIFGDIKAALESKDPHLLVRIWRICRYIYGIGVDQKGSSHLQELFAHLAEVSRDNHSSMSPVAEIFDAFKKMHEEDVLWTLRIGQLRAIQTLQTIVGRDHPTVLCMWSYYAKQWRLHGEYEKLLLDYYERAWRNARADYGNTSSKAISILHDYLYYAVSCCEGNVGLIRSLAKDLYNDASTGLDLSFNETNKKYPWGIYAQYFAFAGRTMAKSFRGTNKEICLKYLKVTAEYLEAGDTECKIRATMLWGELAKWAKKWEFVAEYSLAQERKSLLEQEIRQELRGEAVDILRLE